MTPESVRKHVEAQTEELKRHIDAELSKIPHEDQWRRALSEVFSEIPNESQWRASINEVFGGNTSSKGADMKINEQGKRQIMIMHWTDYFRYFPMALETLFRRRK
ncbi:hypothetical protein BBD42_13040 [Paenibacillus sp. BIHB 4019]|uniref:Uncharacterized protein n=1 Tax=Paenibacillus sp. BIHB 4019 TaxID=1870819 RepID=A0A1B2DHY2_9BACL|nr:hypothetical protein [Paenibacillus sp. BIHB 4019]ANY67296.1 hypothetical protein BBD42_13040 [Paenibacillus sp. BIHB 4019]